MDQVHFALLFYNQSVFQKIECNFFDQVALDLVAELKLKMSQIVHFFMFSALLPEDICKCQYIFTIYGHLAQKATFNPLKIFQNF